MARLLVKNKEGKILKQFILENRSTLGRHPNQSIQILDRMVSKNHALVFRSDGRYYLKDNFSRNGTFLNNLPVGHKTKTLITGDLIRIGSSVLEFKEDSNLDTGALSRVTLHEGLLAANIQKRLNPGSEKEFLPEKKITSPAVLRRDYEKLRIANELNRAIRLEDDQDVLIYKLMDIAFRVFQADRAVILLTEDDQLIPRFCKTRNDQKISDEIRISKTILNTVREEKAALLSSDAMLDSRFSGSESIIMEGIKSTMSVPLMDEEEFLGIIHLDTQIARGAFTEKDLQLLIDFAEQAAMKISHHKLLKQIQEEFVMRENLSRLLSPNLVDEVVKGQIQIRKFGELRQVSILFADIRGFTALGEQNPPQEIVRMLNAYFEVMVDVIFEYQGTLDKFVGDELIGMWGAPVSKPDDINSAVQAACAMMKELVLFNQLREENELVPIEIGIGIDTGEVVVGYIGSSKAMNYTAIGSTVNTASRLCDTAKSGEILITEAVGRGLDGSIMLKKTPRVKLKGIKDTLNVYAVNWNISEKDKEK